MVFFCSLFLYVHPTCSSEGNKGAPCFCFLAAAASTCSQSQKINLKKNLKEYHNYSPIYNKNIQTCNVSGNLAVKRMTGSLLETFVKMTFLNLRKIFICERFLGKINGVWETRISVSVSSWECASHFINRFCRLEKVKEWHQRKIKINKFHCFHPGKIIAIVRGK